MRRNKLFLLLSAGFLAFGMSAQTAMLPYSSGFEVASDNVQWQFSEGNTVNRWYIGGAAPKDGTNALYISNDNGENNTYSNRDYTTAFVWRTFQFDAWDYIISFDWKATGEGRYDLMQVLVLPADVSLTGANQNRVDLGTLIGFDVNTSADKFTQAGYIRLQGGQPSKPSYPWMFNQTTSWQSESVEISIPTKGDYNLVFVWQNDGSSGDNPPAAIDNLSISRKACTNMQDLNITGITASSATLSWTTLLDVVGYDYIVAPATETIADAQAQRTTATSVHISQLLPNTTYIAYVRAVCGEGVGAWKQASFHTDCVEQTIPYTENFDGSLPKGNDVMPYCWHRVAYNSKYPYVFVDENNMNLAHSGSNFLYFYGGNTASEQYAVLPATTENANRLMLSFYYKNRDAGAKYGKVIVGVMSDYTDVSTFVGVDTFPISTTYTLAKSYLNNVPNTHNYVAIKYAAGTAEYGSYVYIDDVELKPMPTCIPVKAMRIDHITTTSADLVWQAGKEETAWLVRYAESGSTDTITTRISGTSALTITGLVHSTLYTYWVSIQSDCGDGDMAEPIETTLSFATECAPFQTQRDSILFGFEPYSTGQSFEDIPCWDTFKGVGNSSYRWKVQSGTAHSGSMYALISNQNDTTKSVVLVTPQVEIPEGSELSFYSRSGYVSTSTRNDRLVVYVNNVPALEGATRLGEVCDLNKTYRFSRFSLPVRGKQYILIEAYNYGSIYVDDILVSPEPACLPPTNLRVYATNAHSATIAWNPGKNETQWLISVDNHKDIYIEDELVEGTPFYTLEDLPSSTKDTIYVKVQSMCDESSLSETAEASLVFTTACEPADYAAAQAGDTLLACGFEIGDDESFVSGWDSVAHNCWTNCQIGYTGYYAPASPIIWTVKTSNAHTGEQALALPSNSSYQPITILALPGMVLADGMELELAFWSKKGQAYYGKTLDSIEVYLNNAPAMAGATRIGTTGLIGEEYTEYTFSPISALAGLNYLILRCEHPSGYADLYIDDIAVRVLPDCRKVRNVEIDNITTHTATLQWTPGNHETAWQVIVTNGADTLINTRADQTSVTMFSLQSGTKYTLDVTIKAVCDDVEAVEFYHAAHTFQTECEAIADYPWSETFEDIPSGDDIFEVPLCWNILGANRGGNTSVFVTGSIAAHEGTKGLTLKTTDAYDAVAFAILPQVETGNELVFYYKSNYSKKPLEVGYLTDPADSTTWHRIAEYKGTTTWTRVILTLACGENVGQPYYGFRYAPNYQYSSQVYIDDVTVHAPSPCAYPRDLHTIDSLATPNSVTVAWAGSADNGYTVTFCGEDTVTLQTTDTFCILDGLQPATRYTYTVKVLAHCMAGDAADVLSEQLTLTTACDAITDFPWEEDFEDFSTGNVNHPCWINEHVSGPGSYLFVIDQSSWGTNGNTTKTLKLTDQSNTTYTRLVLPEMNIPTAGGYDFGLSIWRRSMSSKPTEGIYIIAQTDTLAFIPHDYSTSGINVPAETESNWYIYTFTLPDKGVQNIILLGRNEYGNAVFMDNLFVRDNGKVPTSLPATEDISAAARKVIRNGQVYILHNGKTYNLLGERVENTSVEYK